MVNQTDVLFIKKVVEYHVVKKNNELSEFIKKVRKLLLEEKFFEKSCNIL